MELGLILIALSYINLSLGWKVFSGDKYKGCLVFDCQIVGTLFMRYDAVNTSLFMTYVDDVCGHSR